jgi:ASC-1-like (ASCH) protein
MMEHENSIHHMKLQPSPFEKIKSGEKTIELRLFDEKRQQIKEGDQLVFTQTETGENLLTTVLKLHRFDTFEALYRSLPLLKCGYTPADVDQADPADMEQYYSAEEQRKYGVVGIELSLTE